MQALPIGTRRLSRNGYVRIKTAEGQRHWPHEHRVVWEQANGPLPDGAFIHHLNGIKSDNRLENLHLVRSNSEHHREHHTDIGQRNGRQVGLWNRGRPKSPEHRAKIAAANRGKPKSPEHRARLAAANRGKTIPTEQRAKIAASLRGQKRPSAALHPRDPVTGRFLGL